MGVKKPLWLEKMYTNKRKLDGKVRSCRYICANEGHRKPDKRDHLTNVQELKLEPIVKFAWDL